MIVADTRPQIKAFLRPAGLAATTQALPVRLIAALRRHPGRPSAAGAAGAIRSQARHRAQLVRFLARRHWSRDWATLTAVAELLLRAERPRAGTWAFVVDQTYVGQQGQQTENTFSRANDRPRAKQGNRRQNKDARRSGHGFVCGLRLTPGGLRIPCCRSYYTPAYGQAHGRPYRTQAALAAELIRAAAVPAGAEVVVRGHTAFEAQEIRQAGRDRGFGWVVPVNPERVLDGPKPRPKVASRAAAWTAAHFEAVRLGPGQGVGAAPQRPARCRLGPKAKARTFWVHPRRRAGRHGGDVLLVFSTREEPQAGRGARGQKVLMTDRVGGSAAAVLATYALRWQVELPFKQCKGTLGLHRYRFRQFVNVENGVQACLVALVYLEGYRARPLRRADLGEAAQRWWGWPRCYGLRLAVVEQAEEGDLAHLYRCSGTPSGRRKLRRLLRPALPLEYRRTG
jgi:hypothetical protein